LGWEEPLLDNRHQCQASQRQAARDKPKRYYEKDQVD
jgi:hypothetical protein